MRIRFCCIALIIFCTLHLTAIERRLTPLYLTTSIIIPCHFKHFSMLNELLTEYAINQTVIPDEVIVSLSSAENLSNIQRTKLKYIQDTRWPFRLKILTHSSVLTAGANRNRACQIAKKDIFICQDADDVPHPQRVEIIKWFFENYHVDHLMHGFVESVNKNSMNGFIYLEDLSWESLPEYCLIHNIANGPIAISRFVFNQIKWTEENIHGEDVLFNQEVYKKFPKSVVLYNSLYLYRRGISCND